MGDEKRSNKGISLNHEYASNLLCGLILFLIFAVLYGSIATAQAQVVIIHNDASIDSMPRDTLRAIFSMRLQSIESREMLTVFVLRSDHPLHDEFSKQVLGVFPYQLKRSWDRVVFSGVGRAPIIVDSEEEMLHRVAQTPGGIGYISSAGDYDGVRIVRLLH